MTNLEELDALEAPEIVETALPRPTAPAPSPAPAPAAPGGKPVYANSKPQTSRPFIMRNLTLGSHQAQQVFKRQYKFISNSLYKLSIILRILTTEQGASAIEAIVDAEFQELQNEITDARRQFATLHEQNGIEADGVAFSQPMRYQVQVDTPRATKWLNMLIEMDSLIQMISASYLAGLIVEAQYTSGTYMWQRRVIRSGNRVIHTATRAVAAGREFAKRAGGTEAVSKMRDSAAAQPEQAAQIMQMLLSKGGEEAVQNIEATGKKIEQGGHDENARDDAFSQRIASSLKESMAAAPEGTGDGAPAAEAPPAVVKKARAKE